MTPSDFVPVRLIVVAGEQFGRATQETLAACPEITVTGLVQGAAGVDDAVARERANVVLLHAAHLGRELPVLVRRLGSACPNCRMLVAASRDEEVLALDALGQGAHGHVLEDAHLWDALPAAIRTVMQGAAVVSPRMAGYILDRIILLRKMFPPRQ